MIQVDSRAGSQDIAPVLRRMGMDVDLTILPYGDIAWTGWGANGSLISIGLELKKWNDALACLTSGRFAGHQLPGLLKSYDQVWLLIYGEVRERRDGVMEEFVQGQRGWYWREAGGGQRIWLQRDVESWLMSMTILGGIRVQRARTLEEAAAWTKTAYGWFQRTDHKSHLALFSKELYSDQSLLVKPSLVRRVAAELPGVGLSRSEDVAKRFRTVLNMVEAEESEWSQLMVDGGKRFGERGAKVYKAIRGYENGNGNGK